ncbi:MAG: capsid protein [Clostridiales bacterium]|nr:capsid protein [Clostridiales bacterium]
MGTNVKLNIDSVDKILLKRYLNENGKAQQFFTHEVRRLSKPYVPRQTGVLEDTAVENIDSIEYVQPYARRQYYENSGKNRSKAPLAGKKWDKRMWADRGKEIVQSTARFCGGKAE